MNKRGAYFFVIDALIAGSIVFLSLLVIFTTHNMAPETNPTLRMVDDYSNFLLNTKIMEFQGNYILDLINDGNITNQDNTLLEQLIEFYYLNESKTRNTTTIMQDYLKEVSQGVIPAQRSFAVYVNNTKVYERSVNPVSQAQMQLSSKHITFKNIDDKNYIYGPLIWEVRIWV